MRFIYLSKLAGSDYVLTRRGRPPAELSNLQPLRDLPVPARWVREALARQSQALLAFAGGERRLAGDERAPDRPQQLAARIVAELDRGGMSSYQLWRVVAPMPRVDKIRLDTLALPPPPPTEPPPPAAADHWLDLEVVDADELVADGVRYELTLPDGERRSGSTDADGRVEIRGVAESGHCKLQFPDVDAQAAAPSTAAANAEPAIAYLRQVLSLPLDAAHRVRLPPEIMRAHFVEFDDVFFSFNSTALLPETKDHTPPQNQDGEPVTGLSLCIAVLQYVEQFDGQKSLLILGHTDTVGSDQSNVELSQLRSQVVYGLVQGDRQAFMDAVDAPHINDKNQKAKVLIPDKNFVLDWVAEHTGWPCGFAQNHNDHWAATKQFQIHYNEHGHEFGGSAQLTVDRDFGPGTWGAVFDIYQDYIAKALEIDHAELQARQAAIPWTAPQTKHAGCGEFHPVDLVGRDGIRSATNRRVEAVFFDPGEVPQLECFAGGCAERACELFAPHKIQRKPLPLSWKVLWKVGWDRPAEPARMDEPRTISLIAPKLDDGTVVAFIVEQEVDGARTEVARLEAEAQAERASVEFAAWFNPDTVIVNPQELALDEPFPVIKFHVRATTPERDVDGKRPLIYADTLDAEIGHELVAEVFETDHVEPDEDSVVIHSPWGRKRAAIDEDGVVFVEGLPPGGVMLTIDDDPYYAV